MDDSTVYLGKTYGHQNIKLRVIVLLEYLVTFLWIPGVHMKNVSINISVNGACIFDMI